MIEPGEVAAGDTLERTHLGHCEWSVARCFTAIHAGKATRAELEELAGLPALAPELRQRAAGKLG